ncbi:MAG: hypothetical protein AB7F36_13115 [Reyranellaceae bacterium]
MNSAEWACGGQHERRSAPARRGRDHQDPVRGTQARRSEAGVGAGRRADAAGGTSPQIDSTLVKAIARAFRWQKMLETGQYATIREIAKAEKINPSYVSRVLRLTLLAPATVEAILDGRVNGWPTLADAMAPFPVAWLKQAGNPRHS